MPEPIFTQSSLAHTATLVVGAGSGIGRAVAEQLLQQGQSVVVADLEPGAWDTAKEPPILIQSLDVLSDASIQDLVNIITTNHILLSGLVFTVGKAITLPVQSIKPTMYAELIQLNTISFFSVVTKLLQTDLFNPTTASIVVISSLVGQTGAKGKTAYAATKGGLDAGIRSLACELASDQIRVNAIAPGTLRTPMLAKLISSIGADEVEKLASEYPLGLGLPQDVADLVVFLLGNSSSWISGQVFSIDGGFSAR